MHNDTRQANGLRNYLHTLSLGGDGMTEKEMMQKNIEEFSRLQDYMIDADKASASYKKMKRRYIELKIILTSSGINLTELDIIKE